MNLQPSEAEVGLDIRVPPTANPESLEKRLAEEWAPVSRNMTFEVASFIGEAFMFLICTIIIYPYIITILGGGIV